jgi:putative peptide zinc metalloprotease protein
MATLQGSLVSSTARKLSLRKRPDLSARRQYYHGRIFWVVKEPVGLHYYRFEEEEYELLQMLDGDSSLDDIRSRFERKFPPKKLPVDELQHFLGMLHKSGLVIADVPGQGDELRKMGGERRKQELISMLSNVLSIRFKGIDPERILNWLEPLVSWFFTPTAAAFCFMLFASALLLVLSHFDVFRSRLPEFHQFFGKENWFYLAAAMGMTKVLHEFGHGLSCKHFGGECHEMGVLLLVLTPCLYCNVSDSWMLPNKWHRAIIGAAGMYVELVIASIATFLWWFSEPGMLNQICLNTMFVCSVSTIMFNANPLLRYDGYYILSDLLEIPNLRQKSTTILRRKLAEWCLGMEQPEDPFLPRRNQILFAIYSIASTIYSWVVVLSILWFLNKVFEPYGLKIIGQVLALVSLYGLVIYPCWSLYKFFSVPGRMDQVKSTNFAISATVVVALVLVILFVPVPHRVLCSLEVKPRGAESVYVSVPGRLEEVYVKPGQSVQKGDRLARLSNLDLELAVAEMAQRRDELYSRQQSLGYQRYRDPKAGMEIASMQESLTAAEEQLREKQADLDKLILVAPASGTVLPPPYLPDRPDPDGRLSTWSGSPLEPRNIGATLTESTLFCQIGDPKQMEAILIIDQADVDFIHHGQATDIKLDQLPGDTFHSEIAEISNLDLKVTPRQLSNKAGGSIATKTDPSGVERPMSTSYQARAPIDESTLLRPGLRGQAKIHVGWQSLGSRFWRYLSQQFHFKL